MVSVYILHVSSSLVLFKLYGELKGISYYQLGSPATPTTSADDSKMGVYLLYSDYASII